MNEKDARKDFIEFLRIIAKEKPAYEVPFSQSALDQFLRGERMPTPDAVSQIGQCYDNGRCISLMYKYMVWQQERYRELEEQARKAGVDTGTHVVCSRMQR